MSAKVRINRYLASTGFGSRRMCEELVKRGLVSVNGTTIKSLATVVDPETDSVSVGGRPAADAHQVQVVVLKKPAGVLSTVSDSFSRKTVIDIAREHGYAERLFPVGRLDLDTSGILILTNDGELAYRLTHPRFKIEKTYRVEVTGSLSRETARRLAAGVVLNGYETRPCRVTIIDRSPESTTVEVVLREGKKRQIRRMFAAFGHRVIDLERTALGDLTFDDLAPGNLRPLSRREEHRLRELAGLAEGGKE
jgi:23S rRNA pseudouridine2605 synthase